MSDGKFGSKKLIINDDLEQGNNDDDSKWDVAGTYKTSIIPKSTYYDKWGPNDLFTKSAIGTSKITDFFNSIDISDHNDKDEDEMYSESEEESWYEVNKIGIKLEILKKELENQHNEIVANEYNKKEQFLSI
ncbi:7909_t:CDS:2 [Funneliformis geosporum]|nr:7909_t:CDS:2 [Funneliformis geosporum]